MKGWVRGNERVCGERERVREGLCHVVVPTVTCSRTEASRAATTAAVAATGCPTPTCVCVDRGYGMSVVVY